MSYKRTLPPPNGIIAENLKSLREQAGLFQREVAERLGFSRTSYVYIERQERGVSDEELATFADFYDVPIEAIKGEKETGFHCVRQLTADENDLLEAIRGARFETARNILVALEEQLLK